MEKPISYTFKVLGPLLGSRASVRRAFDPKYKAFKTLVRYYADEAGVPSEPTPTTNIEVVIFWRRKSRIDGGNVIKAIEDAIFQNDRALAGSSWWRHENTGEEKAVVRVRM